MRVAVIHDWLVSYGGAERVLAAILECYPQAEVFTIVDFMAKNEREFLRGRKIHTSFIQRLPLARRHYRAYLPLMPLAVESFDLSGFDLIISSSWAVAKGVLSGPDQLHVCYIHSPIRYAWELQHQYLNESNLERGVRSVVARWLLHRMRLWDARTANGVDGFVSNSQFIARRVWKTYRRRSTVIYPPVDTEFFRPGGKKEDFYLTASRLVPYKCVGLIVDAFARMPTKRLVVIGEGPDYARIARRAPDNVRMLGQQPADVVLDHMQRARAFVFAALEDFGIAPVEAQACGTPVIAFGRGGVIESVISGRTGTLFEQQSADALVAAIERFESSAWAFNPNVIRENALRFAADRFKRQFVAYVDAAIDSHSRRQAAVGPSADPDQPVDEVHDLAV
jgi:glycosyltransferase involved in cell wall biosynthesis